MLRGLLLLLSQCAEPAAGVHVYVSIARLQNAWWQSVVAEFVAAGC
jgi:hypothetical protein